MRGLRFFLQATLFLWIFSIPTSLAYHFDTSAGMVSGILVDYRIPQISACALLFSSFVAFFAAFMVVKKKKTELKNDLNRLGRVGILALLCALLFQVVLAL